MYSMTNEQIQYSLKNRKLKLSYREKFSHYGIVVFCFFVPVLFMLFHLKDFLLGTPKPLSSGVLWFIGIPTILGIMFYFLQEKRLNFKEVNTNLTRVDLDKIIDKIANELEWDLIVEKKSIVKAKTHPGFLSGSWGEQITILFDNGKVLINSICDLDKKSSIISSGRNRQNVNKFIKEILKYN